MKKIIKTNKSPKAIGTYSQGTIYENLVFTSGQICIHPKTGELVNDNFKNEVRQVLDNLNGILISGGSGLNNIF